MLDPNLGAVVVYYLLLGPSCLIHLAHFII
jgi:hypothetical protein